MHLMLQCRVFVVLFSLLRCSGSTSVARKQHFQLTPAGGNQCPSTDGAFQGLTTRSRIQCAAECDLLQQCSGFSYYASSRSCYLYDYLPPIFTVNSDCNFMKDTNADLDSNSATTAPLIVIMERFDGSVDFDRSWIEYRNGFGDKAGGGEFWLGNEEIHRLTNNSNCTLRIEVQPNTSVEWYYAEYSTFSLESENNNYTLRLSGYSGNAGDSLVNPLLLEESYLGGMSFTTRNNDNDMEPSGNCAVSYSGGWWFNKCFSSCLTCRYLFGFYWLCPRGCPPIGLLRAARMMIKGK